MAIKDKTYTPPKKAELFMKYEDGDNRLRILSDIETGYEYWTKDAEGNKKSHKTMLPPSVVPSNIDGTVKGMWVMAVWNYREERVQILEIRQASIYEKLYELEKNDIWGDTKNYNIVINRTGAELKTRYTVTPEPHSDLPEKVKGVWEAAVIEDKDNGTKLSYQDYISRIFKDNSGEEEIRENNKSDEEINPDDIPF